MFGNLIKLSFLYANLSKQLLENGNHYQTWTRWGRVGEQGQSAVLGDGSLDDALRNFEKKFKDKSGLKWADRGEKPKPNKYVFVEKSYDPDSEEEEGGEDETKAGASRERSDYVPPKCTLAPPVESLMELIFNQQYFEATMVSTLADALTYASILTSLPGFSQLRFCEASTGKAQQGHHHPRIRGA